MQRRVFGGDNVDAAFAKTQHHHLPIRFDVHGFAVGKPEHVLNGELRQQAGFDVLFHGVAIGDTARRFHGHDKGNDAPRAVGLYGKDGLTHGRDVLTYFRVGLLQSRFRVGDTFAECRFGRFRALAFPVDVHLQCGFRALCPVAFHLDSGRNGSVISSGDVLFKLFKQSRKGFGVGDALQKGFDFLPAVYRAVRRVLCFQKGFKRVRQRPKSAVIRAQRGKRAFQRAENGRRVQTLPQLFQIGVGRVDFRLLVAVRLMQRGDFLVLFRVFLMDVLHLDLQSVDFFLLPFVSGFQFLDILGDVVELFGRRLLVRVIVAFQFTVLPFQLLPRGGGILAVQLFGQFLYLRDGDFAFLLMDVAVEPVGKLFLRRVLAATEPRL